MNGRPNIDFAHLRLLSTMHVLMTVNNEQIVLTRNNVISIQRWNFRPIRWLSIIKPTKFRDGDTYRSTNVLIFQSRTLGLMF